MYFFLIFIIIIIFNLKTLICFQILEILIIIFFKYISRIYFFPPYFEIFLHFFILQIALELNGVLNSSKKQVCSIIISGFWLEFRGLSPYSFGILFHHHFLVPARVPGLVSLVFLASCSIIISWFRLGFRGLSP